MTAPVACPACAAAGAGRLGTLGGLPLLRCPRCKHGFLVVPSAADVEVLYDDHYAGFRTDPVFQREAARVLAHELVRRRPPPARLLDVGCGNGDFLALARDAGYAVTGVDVSAAAGERGRARGLDVRVGDVRSPAVVGDDERFDLISFWDVVEHLPDPASFLVRARELLAPGGYLLLKTPRTSTGSVLLSSAVPRVAGALLQAPSHIQYFSRDGLAALLRRSGFAGVDWLPSRPMRSIPAGGTVRKRVARRTVALLRRTFGDGNLLVLARRA